MRPFTQEIMTRQVVDAAGDLLGHLADFTVDVDNGNIVAILVVTEQGSILPSFRGQQPTASSQSPSRK